MNNYLIVIGVVLVALFVLYCLNNKPSYPPPREGATLRAYPFGFATHGSYHGTGPLKGWPYGGYGYGGYGRPWGGYGGYGSPYGGWGSPYRGRPYGRYYRRNIKPYLTGTCYSSSETDGCRRGYSKTRKDSDGDGDIDDDDDWLCCRDRDMF